MQGRNRDADIKTDFGHMEEGEGGTSRESRHICTVMCKLASQWEAAARAQRAQPSALWQPRGLGRRGRGEEVQEGGDICVLVAHLHCSMVDANTIL